MAAVNGAITIVIHLKLISKYDSYNGVALVYKNITIAAVVRRCSGSELR